MDIYGFRQNKTGGYFHKIRGNVATWVFIEAKTPAQANRIARKQGIYFDGVSTGEDCSCCGDRWCKVDETDVKQYNRINFNVVDPNGILFLADGTINTFRY